MTKKDGGSSEDIALGKKAEPEKKDDVTESEKKGKQTEVKNAHAAGDGAFGRSDSSLSEDRSEANESNGEEGFY